jgi:3-oxoadipate enol-lactonase
MTSASSFRWTASAPSICYTLDGNGPRNLIAIHELGGSLHSFADIVPYLSRDFRILRYDQRGAGLSEKPRQPFTFADHVADLERVLDHADIAPPYRLLGLAAGAAIALAFAHKHPKDSAALVLCAPALSVSGERREYLATRTALAARDGMRAVEGDTLSRSYPQRYRERNPARFAVYRAAFLANDPVGYGHINMAFADSDIGDAITALRAPCLLLAGEHDALRPPDQVKATVSQIEGARFDVIDSGHIMPVQAPEAMGNAVGAFFQSA